MKRRCRPSDSLDFLNCRKAFLMRGTAFNVNCCKLRIPFICPVTLQRTAGDPHTHTNTWRPISLDDADGVSPGAPNANAEVGDPAGDVVAIIGPRTTLASARDPETVFYRVKHEQRRSKPLRSNNRGSCSWYTSRTHSQAKPCASFAKRTAISSMPRLGSGPLPI